MNSEQYKELLKDARWKSVVEKRSAIDGWKCHDCEGAFGEILTSPQPLDCHHIRYPKSGIPWEVNVETDVVMLCRHCHHRLHFNSHGKKREGDELLLANFLRENFSFEWLYEICDIVYRSDDDYWCVNYQSMGGDSELRAERAGAFCDAFYREVKQVFKGKIVVSINGEENWPNLEELE